METKNCMGEAPAEAIAAEMERRIREGNLKCACCLSDGMLTSEQKVALVDAIIVNSQIDSKAQIWIDDRVSSGCKN
jgi:hypothetical protein